MIYGTSMAGVFSEYWVLKNVALWLWLNISSGNWTTGGNCVLQPSGSIRIVGCICDHNYSRLFRLSAGVHEQVYSPCVGSPPASGLFITRDRGSSLEETWVVPL